MIFSTERLVVREWTGDDLDAIRAIYSRDEVTRWLGGPARTNSGPEAPADRLARWRGLAGGNPAYGVWAVTPGSGGTPVGSVLLIPLPGGAGEVEVGWHLHPDAWGHGYATEAARGALGYGFGTGLREIFAVVAPANVRSLGVAHRLGMTPLGRTDRYYGQELELFRSAAPGG